MKKYLLVGVFIIFWGYVFSQHVLKKTARDTSIIKIDTAFIDAIQNFQDGITVITLDDAEVNDVGSGLQNISSLLTAGKDPFLNLAAYNFNTARFTMRGYDAEKFSTYINGVPLENLDNGFTPFGVWEGLNEVMRNRDISIGLKASNFAFGKPGNVTNIDCRASKQRKQTEINYSFANRTYQHKISFTHSTGFNKKGWAFTLSGSRRWSDEGYIAGTYIDAWGAFIAIDKRFNGKHLLSLVAFDAPAETGRTGYATAEAQTLAESHYYNPDWGYQNGKKRNAVVAKNNQPVIILSHEYKISSKSFLNTGIGYSSGRNNYSGLDWYNVPDPRPDYYKNLPSYYADNPSEYQAVVNRWRSSANTRQINWDNLYNINRSFNETYNGVQGLRSRYLLSNSANDIQKFNFNTVYNTKIKERIDFTAGLSYEYQKNRFYKKIEDLLGGDYYVDLNQFAEYSFPNDESKAQPDLNHQNRIVHVGDKYKYDYDIINQKTSGWIQSVFKLNKVDFFVAADIANTVFWRDGNMKNGLFPTNSYGKSTVNNFTDFSFKSGITYKINGRNYLYLNALKGTHAPYFIDIYISPMIRDDVQKNITGETINSLESGYVLNAPKIKLRLTGYYTEFKNQMQVMSFFHDAYQNFVNYAISHINKQHYGMEFGFNAKVLPNITVEGAAAIGRFVYNSRQLTTITVDNDATYKSIDTVYANGYRTGGTPQEAYSFGISYRSSKFWFISLTGNYFDQMWMEKNPIRLTSKAVENTLPNSPERAAILNQQQFNGQFILNLFASYSKKLPKKWGFRNLSGSKKIPTIGFSAGVDNLLDNKNIIYRGFEQLRFDFNGNDINKFPPKYGYAMGLNYFIGTYIRF